MEREWKGEREGEEAGEGGGSSAAAAAAADALLSARLSFCLPAKLTVYAARNCRGREFIRRAKGARRGKRKNGKTRKCKTKKDSTARPEDRGKFVKQSETLARHGTHGGMKCIFFFSLCHLKLSFAKGVF